MDSQELEVDKDVRRAFDYFASYLKQDVWKKRRTAIESQIESFHSSEPGARLSIADDRSGWYLYLIECFLFDQQKYEPLQGCRILPIFKRLGEDLELLKQIHGIDRKINALLNRDLQNPDTTLFEILIALLWKRNGWPLVEFIDESATEKTADIRATSDVDE